MDEFITLVVALFAIAAFAVYVAVMIVGAALYVLLWLSAAVYTLFTGKRSGGKSTRSPAREDPSG